jgi:hypothetical protein
MNGVEECVPEGALLFRGFLFQEQTMTAFQEHIGGRKALQEGFHQSFRIRIDAGSAAAWPSSYLDRAPRNRSFAVTAVAAHN